MAKRKRARSVSSDEGPDIIHIGGTMSIQDAGVTGDAGTRVLPLVQRAPVHQTQPSASTSLPAPSADISSKKKKSTSGVKLTTSAEMKEFQEKYASSLFDVMLDSESLKDQSCLGCSCAWSNTCAPYRCTDCFHQPTFCASCMRSTHRYNPFHRILRWNGSFFEKATLQSIGLVVDLGHRRLQCPSYHLASDQRHISITDSSGLQDITVRYCTCSLPSPPSPPSSSATPQYLQLWRVGLFSATFKSPETAFSARAFKDFRMLTVQGSLNAYDFLRHLRRKTNNAFVSEVKEPYRRFMHSYRQWSYLQTVKHHGQRPSFNHPPRSLAVLCPACPQMSINITQDQWTALPSELQFLVALYFNMDGNFQLNQKDKPMDLNDRPLTLGAAYYPNEEAYLKYISEMSPDDNDKDVIPSTCSNFVALQKNGRYAGKRVSGTVALSCKHEYILPCGCVDLQWGERYSNVDQAVLHGLEPYRRLPLLFSSYDVNCQYKVHFWERMSVLGWIPLTMKMIFGVGKFHLLGHRDRCRGPLSFHHLLGAGRFCGEGGERRWPATNAIASFVREMGPGQMHDTINDHHSDQNIRKTHTITATLCKKIDKLKPKCDALKEDLIKLETTLTELGEPLSDWKAQEREWLKQVMSGTWPATLENPYIARADTAPSAKAILAQLDKEIDGGRLAGLGTGVPAMIQEGIDIELLQLQIIAKSNDVATDENLSKLGDLRRRLLRRLESYKTWQMSLMAPLDIDLEAFSSTTVPETQSLELPSSLPQATLSQPGLTPFVEAELRLRKAQCSDSLRKLREKLSFRSALEEDSRINTSGQRAKTRSRGLIERNRDAVQRAKTTYSVGRAAIRVLAQSRSQEELQEVGDSYPPLTNEDLVPLRLDPTLQLGYSDRRIAWFWREAPAHNDRVGEESTKAQDVADKENLSGWESERTFLRVEWFTCSAQVSRAQEEVVLIGEELRRIRRFFEYWQNEWLSRATAARVAEQAGNAAYSLRQADIYSRLLRDCTAEMASRDIPVDRDLSQILAFLKK